MEEAGKEALGRLPATAELLSGSLPFSYALGSFLPYLHITWRLWDCGVYSKEQKGGKGKGKASMQEQGQVPETDREELRWKQLLPLWPSAFIRRLKNRRHRVAQMPFIGQGSIAHSGLGRAPLIGPVSHLPSPGSSRHPQGRGSSWAQVAGRARIKNIGLGSERGAW